MKNKATFAYQVKQEIASETEFSTERRIALLSAYIRINGVLSFNNKKECLRLRSENSKVARYIYSELKKLNSNWVINLDFNKKNSIIVSYIITVESGTNELLNSLKIDYFEGKIPKEIAHNDETISGYIAGAFLASGSVNTPETTNYHLEVSVNNENYARWLSKLIVKYSKLELTPKLIKRRDKHVIYFKRSDQISNFLVLIGAPESCIQFENARVKRDFINSNNRLINFDEANMKKASVIGKRQAKEIKYIDEVLGIHNLHNPKKELLCYLRMENKELSLVELANMLSDEMGTTITKSNVNHLFRSLHDLYERLQGVNKR